jgi:hypothetical protein
MSSSMIARCVRPRTSWSGTAAAWRCTSCHETSLSSSSDGIGHTDDTRQYVEYTSPPQAPPTPPPRTPSSSTSTAAASRSSPRRRVRDLPPRPGASLPRRIRRRRRRATGVNQPVQLFSRRRQRGRQRRPPRAPALGVHVGDVKRCRRLPHPTVLRRRGADVRARRWRSTGPPRRCRWRGWSISGGTSCRRAARVCGEGVDLAPAFPAAMVVIGGFDLLKDWQLAR